eukprot:6960489-Pyramimonas_sp.AAC.2
MAKRDVTWVVNTRGVKQVCGVPRSCNWRPPWSSSNCAPRGTLRPPPGRNPRAPTRSPGNASEISFESSSELFRKSFCCKFLRTSKLAV